MGAILVIMFILFVALGVPISFALGVVSFTGIASLAQIPNTVVFSKMFNGLNSFTLLAVPLFIQLFNSSLRSSHPLAVTNCSPSTSASTR